MANVTIGGIVKTSVVTAFTFAAALIWRDVIIEIIDLVVPPAEVLHYKVLAAVIATVIVIIGIYAVLETEAEAEVVIKRIKRRKKKAKK
jgi:hypothetical protein